VLGYNAFRYVLEGRWGAVERKTDRWFTGLVITLGAAMIGVWIARFFGAFGGPVPV
jgi:hypothetical protein